MLVLNVQPNYHIESKHSEKTQTHECINVHIYIYLIRQRLSITDVSRFVKYRFHAP